MKVAVFCVVALSVASLTAMLIEGCKREETENPPVDTNQVTSVDTNAQLEASNPPVVVPPISTNVPTANISAPLPNVATPMPTEAPESGSTYVVVKGDTLGKIAHAHGVSVKALEAANPNVQPTRLKLGEKLNIPAGASGGSATSSDATSASDTSSAEVYVVKSGDTLSRIAHSHGTTVKALEAENNLSTTKIKVGQKLKIPAGAESTNLPAAAPAQLPVTTPAPGLQAPAASAPAAPTAPAPTSNGQ